LDVPVEISDQGIRWVGRDSEAKEVSWLDLAEIRIVTNGNGPFMEDVFFGFIASEANFLMIPQSDIDQEALRRLQQLPGFDNSALIEAMSSVTDAQFVVWRANSGG
jgi:hypothetical protein